MKIQEVLSLLGLGEISAQFLSTMQSCRRRVKDEAYRPALLQSILGPQSGSSGFIKSAECNLRQIALWFFGASPRQPPHWTGGKSLKGPGL